MLRRRLSAGVEIGSSTARLVLIQPRPVPTVLKVRELPLGQGDDNARGRLIAKALNELGAKGANVHLAFSTPGAPPAKLFQAPKLRRAELRQVAMRELRRDAQLESSKMHFDVERIQTVPLEDGRSAEQYVAGSLEAAVLNGVAGALHSARHVVRSATSSTLAAMKTASFSELSPDKVVAIAHVDSRRSSLMVLQGGLPLFFRDFPNDQYQVKDEAMISQTIAREMEISLVYFAQQHRPKKVESIMVLGSPTWLDRVSEIIESEGVYELIRFGENDKFKVAKGVPKDLNPFAAAIGAALPAGKTHMPNVLPRDLRGQPERVLAVVVTAVLILAGAAGIMQLRDTHTERLEQEQQRFEAAQGKLAVMLPQIDKIGRTADAAGHAEKWSLFFEGKEQEHYRMGNFLVELAQILPKNGHISRMSIEPQVTTPNPRARARQAAAKSESEYSHKVALQGVIRGSDLSSLPPALLAFDADLKALPGVVNTVRYPWGSSSPQRGVEEISFSVDLYVKFK